MTIPNFPNLFFIFGDGAEGGLQFSRLMKDLLEAEHKINPEFVVQNFNDAAGDYKGVDAIVQFGLEKIGVQFKYYATPFSQNHKSEIKKSYKAALSKFPEMDEWWLVTPQDLLKHDLEWIQNLANEEKKNIIHKGYSFLIDSLLKHDHIGGRIYENYDFKKYVRERNEISLEKVESFFLQFLQPDFDIDYAISKAQPTYADCRKIFNDASWEEFGDFINELYKGLASNQRSDLNLEGKDVVDVIKVTFEQLQQKNHSLAGGMNEMVEVFNSNVVLYRIVFRKRDNESGTSLNVWLYVNGRWIFLPKPWRILQAMKNVRSDSDLKYIIRVLKFFKKRIVKQKPVQLRMMAAHAIRELMK